MRFVFSESIDEVRLEERWPGGREPLAASAVRIPPVFLTMKWWKLLPTNAATDVLTALFPTDCLLCAGPMTSLARERVCDACVGAVRRASEPVCARCGEALGFESARFAAAMRVSECTACRLVPPAFARASAYAAFEGNLRELIHLLKFGEQRLIADRVLGPWLADAMLAAIEGLGKELLVVPVPMFRERERRRGFNQAALLAGAAIRHLRKARPDLGFVLDASSLVRVRDTQPLFALAPHQRRRSLKGAFRVMDASRLRGREVVLVDDIMTTGATARECARVLLAAGAMSVVVATVARAQPEGAGSVESWSESSGITEPGETRGSGREEVARWDALPPRSLSFQGGIDRQGRQR